MALTANGLSEYNPLLCSNSDTTYKCYSTNVELFKAYLEDAIVEDIDFVHISYENLMQHYKALEDLIIYCAQCSDNDIVQYEKRFLALLVKLENYQSNYSEEFWDDLYILTSILLKVSAVRECRQLISNNLQRILVILKFAVMKEREFCPNNSEKIHYSIAYFFIANKFKDNASIDDDDLMKIAKEQCMPNFNFEVFSLISQYKNCNKCDLAPMDLLNEFEQCLKANTNYFWIYAYYVQKYKKLLENFFINMNGELIYDCWFSYVLSKEFYERTKDYSKEDIQKLLTDEINAFQQAGIYTYEATSLITKMCRERS